MGYTEVLIFTIIIFYCLTKLLIMARKKPKRPKAPKHSATLQSWQNYKKRLDAWRAACRQIDADKKKKSSLITSIRKQQYAA